MNNKEASTKQENMFANYMGWRVVSGSGSRPFAPGDVKNEHYLVECKTHTSEQNKIIFYKNHWEKISIEAQSVHKYPALVTDNGTQNSKYTWVAIPVRIIPIEMRNNISGSNKINTTTSGNTLTYSLAEISSIYRMNYSNKNNTVTFIGDSLNNEHIAVMPLSEFKKFYEDQFEL